MMRVMDPFLPDDRKLDQIRELLPSLGSGTRLDTTVAGPLPAETDRAVRQLDELELRVGRGGRDRAEDLTQRADEAASVVAAVLATTPDRVALTPGPLAALSATLLALGPETGQVVIAGPLPGPLDAALDAVASAHRLPVSRAVGAWSSGPALVVTAHVDPELGSVVDPRPLAREVHAAGGALLVDMGWSAGAIPVDAPSSEADLVLVDMHRWLLGPEGVSAVWASGPAMTRRLRRVIDTPPPGRLLGVARSVGWLLMYVGLPWAFERAESLTGRLRAALEAIEGVRVGPHRGDRAMATTIPFAIDGWEAAEVATELARRVHAHLDVDAVGNRLLAGVGAWLREDEIDRFAGAIAELAAHTPETLPRKPLLTVLSAEPQDER